MIERLKSDVTMLDFVRRVRADCDSSGNVLVQLYSAAVVALTRGVVTAPDRPGRIAIVSRDSGRVRHEFMIGWGESHTHDFPHHTPGPAEVLFGNCIGDFEIVEHESATTIRETMRASGWYAGFRPGD